MPAHASAAAAPITTDVALYRALIGYVTISFPSGREDACKVEAQSEFAMSRADNFNKWWTIDLAYTCGGDPAVHYRTAHFICVDFQGRDVTCQLEKVSQKVEPREPKTAVRSENSSSAGAR